MFVGKLHRKASPWLTATEKKLNPTAFLQVILDAKDQLDRLLMTQKSATKRKLGRTSYAEVFSTRQLSPLDPAVLVN